MPRIGALKGRKVETPRVDAAPPPQIPATPLWWYKHHPRCWMVADGKVLPSLRTMKRIEGVNDVRRGGSMRHTRAGLAERGWTVLEHDADPGGGDYLQAYPVAKGTAYMSTYTQVFSGSSATRTDSAGYYAFLQRLVDGGVLAPPPVYVLDDMVEKYTAAAERYEGKGTAAGDARGAALRADAKVALACRDALYADPAPAPKPQPKSKRKAVTVAED
jgi:hypothetical protein